MNRPKDSLIGNVESGLGHGQKFLSMPAYAKSIQSLVGFQPFPGTLNVRIPNPAARIPFLSKLDCRTMRAFSIRKKKYGGFDLYFVQIAGNIQGAVIVPHKTKHANDVIELIAREHLRSTLNLVDGDKIRLEPKY